MKYVDLHKMPEDKRIAYIAHETAKMDVGRVVGVPTDDEPGKPERYAMKISLAAPHLELMDRTPGPVPGVVTLRFRRI